MAQPFQAVVEELQEINDQTDTLISLSKKNAENTSSFDGVSDILKNDFKEGFKDLAGTITAPLKAFAQSVPGLSTLGKITSNITKNAVTNFKERVKESKLDKKEHKENILIEKKTQQKIE